MRLENDRILFSATDLAHFLGCKHATELDRAVAAGRLAREYRKDHMLDLLIELGERHERPASIRADAGSVGHDSMYRIMLSE